MNYKHGLAKSRLDNCYVNMISRCYNPKNGDFFRYGARGIIVCDEWKNDKSKFFEWSQKNGYSDNFTIDRIDVNGNYEPSNCRWVTIKQQQNNRRSNHFIEAFGKKKTIAEWSEITKIKPATIQARLVRGWTPEDALTMEVEGNGWDARRMRKMVIQSRS